MIPRLSSLRGHVLTACRNWFRIGPAWTSFWQLDILARPSRGCYESVAAPSTRCQCPFRSFCPQSTRAIAALEMRHKHAKGEMIYVRVLIPVAAVKVAAGVARATRVGESIGIPWLKIGKGGAVSQHQAARSARPKRTKATGRLSGYAEMGRSASTMLAVPETQDSSCLYGCFSRPQGVV